MKIEPIDGNRASSRWEAYENYRNAKQAGTDGQGSDLAAKGTGESLDTKRVNGSEDCNTCSNRKYQDGSDDPGVSFQTPTKLSPKQAASAVRGHEMEHVGRERGKAMREDREVVSQSVTYRNGICPECGDVYLAGGTTRTTTRGKQESKAEEIQVPEKSQGFKAMA